MKAQMTLWAIVLAFMTHTQARAGEPNEWDVHRPHFLARLRPVGGCNPDGRGLFHWWNPHCFSRSCGPDTYCRKPMPNVCRPLAFNYDSAYPQQQPMPAPTYSP
jgi:hypothetical protein